MGPIVRKVDNFSQRINTYPTDTTGEFLILIERANFIRWIKLSTSSTNGKRPKLQAKIFINFHWSDTNPSFTTGECRNGTKGVFL